jgi:hypothetical protein
VAVWRVTMTCEKGRMSVGREEEKTHWIRHDDRQFPLLTRSMKARTSLKVMQRPPPAMLTEAKPRKLLEQ